MNKKKGCEQGMMAVQQFDGGFTAKTFHSESKFQTTKKAKKKTRKKHRNRVKHKKVEKYPKYS